MTETIYTLKKVHTQSFTVLGNEMFRDQGLPLRERGLLGTMLSLDDGWRFTVRGLASILYDGESAIRASLRLLEKQGYLRRERLRDAAGRLTAMLYQVSDAPVFLDTVVLQAAVEQAAKEQQLQEALTPESGKEEDPEDEQLSFIFPTPEEPSEAKPAEPLKAKSAEPSKQHSHGVRRNTGDGSRSNDGETANATDGISGCGIGIPPPTKEIRGLAI